MNVLKKIEYIFFPCQKKLDEAQENHNCALKELKKNIEILRLKTVQKSQ
jgi:hypothetical protein